VERVKICFVKILSSSLTFQHIFILVIHQAVKMSYFLLAKQHFCFAESGPVDTKNVLAGPSADVHTVSTWL
jgi:hypothetical protein